MRISFVRGPKCKTRMIKLVANRSW